MHDNHTPSILGMLLGSVLSLLGSLAAYAQQILSGAKYSKTTLVLHLAVCAFAGLLATLTCSYMELPLEITGILSGISGYSGSAVLNAAERLLISRVESGGTKP